MNVRNEIKGQRKTRKEVREEKAKARRKGLVTPEAIFYGVRIVIAIVGEYFRSL